MSLASQMRSAWDRATGKPSEPERKPEAMARPAEQRSAPQPSYRPVPKGAPNPAQRAFSDVTPDLNRPRQQAPSPPPQHTAEATKMEYTRTAQPGPSPNSPHTTFRNPTSTFKPEQAKPAPAKTPDAATRPTLADFQKRDDQAADQQKAADRAASQPDERKIDRFRRPGEAPKDRDFGQAANRTGQERQVIDQFSRQFDRNQGRER